MTDSIISTSMFWFTETIFFLDEQWAWVQKKDRPITLVKNSVLSYNKRIGGEKFNVYRLSTAEILIEEQNTVGIRNSLIVVPED